MPSSPTWDDTQEIPTWDDTREPSEYDFVEGELKRHREAVNAPRPPRVEPAKPFDQARFDRRMALEEQKRQAELEAIPAEMAVQIHDPIVPPRVTEAALAIGAPALNTLPGIRSAVAEAASGFTSPVNLALAGAAGGGGAVARGIAGGFAADMARHVPEAARTAGEVSVTGTPDEAQKAIGDVAIQIGLTGLAGGGAAQGARLPQRGILTKELAVADNAARAGMNVGLNKSVEALKEVTREDLTKQSTTEVKSALQESPAAESVLREERPEVELQRVEPPRTEAVQGEIAPAIPAEAPRTKGAVTPERISADAVIPEDVQLRRIQTLETRIIDELGKRGDEHPNDSLLALTEGKTLTPDQYEAGLIKLHERLQTSRSQLPQPEPAKGGVPLEETQRQSEGQIPIEHTAGAAGGEYAARAKLIADKLREQFKTPVGPTELGTFGVVPKVINGAVELAAKTIEAGGTAADAMAAAIKYVADNHKTEWDEAGFRKAFSAAVVIPDTAGESVKTRKSAEQAVTSPMIPEPVQERIAEAPESRYTQQRMTRVDDAVKALSDGELAAIPADSNLYVASRLEQADRRFKAGDNDGGYGIFVELEKQGTSFGQNINQFKRLAGTRPEHVAVLIDKKLQAAGKDPLTPEQRTKAIDLATKSKEADRALDAATDAWEKKPSDANARAAETALDAANESALKLQEFTNKFQPRTVAGTLKAVLQGNLLTPISEVANLFGNVSFLPFRAIDRSVATGLDVIDSGLRSKPREVSVAPVSGTVEAAKGAGRGLKQVPAILARGTGNVIQGETRAGLHPIKAWIDQFAKNPERPTVGGKLTLSDRLGLAIEGTFGVPAEVMLRGLGAGDAPFREAARARVTAEQLRLKGVPNNQWAFAQKFPELFLPKEALETIGRETSQAVFQRESKTLNLFTNWLRGKGEWFDFAVSTVAPYKLTPWNIISEILSYNPLLAIAKGVRDAKRGNTREAKLNAGKMVVGSMLTGAGIWLYKNGLLAPSLDERNEAQKARVLSGKVLPPNHINISGLKRALEGGDPAFKEGDETVDIFRAGGLAGSMFYMTANIGRDIERGPETTNNELWTSIIRNSVLEQARFGLNQSFLQGIEGMLSAIKEGQGDNFVRRWANTVASIPLPNTLNSLTKATREYQIDPKGEDFKSSIQTMLKNKLGFAGLDDYLPLKRDFWGKPMLETPEGRNAIFYHFFDISKNKQVTSDPVELELYRLWRKTGDTKVIPSLPEREVTLQRQTYALKPKQYERYAELVGTNRRQIVDAIVVNPEFHKLSDEQKMTMLTRIYDRGAQIGKALFSQEFPPSTLTKKAGRAGFRTNE